ncbi:PRC-barrel domain-containing protein [Rhodoligotrophos defluvii]|uniref:PRC-barrel domain-containing protein n=1 Tax=Rhodoligotrophos defluvii TaxID=2561934 RepID=UPI001EF0241C|nr:PRC-barrel domain-containing protein [Rhodoligotrophos defluvii]
MQTKHVLCATVATLSLAMAAHGAAAQQSNQQTQQQQPQAQQQQAVDTGQRQVAQQCLNDLQAFNQRMDQDGYWLVGWGAPGYGVAPPAAAPANPPTAAQPPATTGATGTTGLTGTADTAMTGVGQPWVGAGWGITSAPYQIRTLHAATNVLAHRGDQQACAAVLAELRQVYDNYVNELRQAGVEPGEVTSWRQQRIIAARPVTELQTGLINLADITGTEVRSPQDEQLGTVEDVVLDPQSGNIGYVILSSGGVLGIGEDMVAVPWRALKATPGLNTFVLNVSEQTIEQAPTVDPDSFADPTLSAQDRQRVDEFWQQHMAG